MLHIVYSILIFFIGLLLVSSCIERYTLPPITSANNYLVNAAFYSSLEYKNGSIVSMWPDNRFFTCWQTKTSKNLMVGTSLQLSEDILYQYPLTTIPSSIKLSIKHSILVRQYGISKETFDYWQLLKKNTETTGSILDAQPSQLTGNITCVNNPAEPVIRSQLWELDAHLVYEYTIPINPVFRVLNPLEFETFTVSDG